MKRIFTQSAIALSLFFVIAGITSCNKDVNVYLQLGDQQICIPAYATQPGNGHIHTFDYSFKTEIQKAFGDQGLDYAENRVDDVKLVSVAVDFVSGNKGNLKDLSGVQLYAKKAGTSGYGKQVAEVNITSETATTLNLNVTGESLKEFLAEDLITFTATAFIRNNNSEAVCVKLKDAKIEIQAKK